MKKSLTAILGLSVLALCSCVPLTTDSSASSDGSSSSSQSESGGSQTSTSHYDDTGKLSVMVYSAGYGMGWMDNAIKSFNQAYPGIKVTADGDPLAFDSIKQKLEAGNCPYDVVLVASTYFSSLAAKGYLECLDDMYATTIPGTEKTVKDVIPAQIYNAKKINGKAYSVPWQENVASGLIYNVSMFEKYNWKLPKTMDELWTLADTIVSDTGGNVAPLTFGGVDGFGYMNWNYCEWLCQYYGYDNMMDFLQLASPDVYQNQSAGRKKIYETIAKITRGTTTDGHSIALKGSVGSTAITAQSNFVNEKAAMTICGQWFKTEMEPYTSITDFKAGYCAMPHINYDRKSGDGKVDTSTTHFSDDGNMMAIPTTAKNKDLAKKFLTYMFTDGSYTSFVKSNNGLLRPIENVVVDSSSFDETFTKPSYEAYYNDGKAKTVYQISKDSLIETGTLALFMAYRGAFFSAITSKSNYADALNAADSCVASELASVNEHWDSKTSTWF